MEDKSVEWTWVDYVLFPVAFVDGASAALPEESYAFNCNKNILSARKSIDKLMIDVELMADVEAMITLNEFLSHIDDITKDCYLGFWETFEADTYLDLFGWEPLLLNFLYNAGFMYFDLLNIFGGNGVYETVTWPYFLAYNVGDLVVRFFYRDV